LTKRSDELRVLLRSFRFADGVDPKRFLRQISSKDLFCVAGKIFFVNFRKGSFAARNVSGRDYPFFA
jgi:hypothetical protein